MPYIIAADRQLEFRDGINCLQDAAEQVRASEGIAKAEEARAFLAYLIDDVYAEQCFDKASNVMAASLSEALRARAVALAANIAEIHEREGGGREGLLNYTLTRFFNEAYPSARYKDYNAIAGVLTSLIQLSHPGRIELLGMLDCCRAEYYRKYAAPYEDKKESENGAVERPEAPGPTAY